jgi:hypothetical protein
VSKSKKVRSNAQLARADRDKTFNAWQTYINSPSYHAKRGALMSLEKSNGTHIGHLNFAQAHFELATMSLTSSLQGEHIERMANHAVLARRTLVGAASLIALAQFEANVPAMIGVHLQGEHPTAEQLEVSYKRMAEALMLAYNEHDHSPVPYDQRSKANGEYVGAASEALCLSMLQRYAVDSIGSGNWSPLPSLFTENHSSNRRMRNQSWDVSVYDNDLEQPAYKVQVKWGWTKLDPSDDVQPLYMSMLGSPDGRKLRLGGLIHHFANVALGESTEQYSQEVVSTATDRILDAMDQVIYQ